MRSWFNVAMALLAVAVAADLVFGIAAVLEAVSILAAIVALVVAAGAVIVALVVLGWIVVSDAAGEIDRDRRNGRPWRWRYAGWIGIGGMVADGAIGSFNAWQEQIAFSAAVEEIPFAGMPVILALSSYPLRWIEGAIMARRRPRKF